MDLRAHLRKAPFPPAARSAAQRRRTQIAPPLALHSPHAAAAIEHLTDAIAHEAAQPMQALSSILRELRLRLADDALTPLADEGVRRLDELRVLQDELRDAVSPARGERLRGTWVHSMFDALRERLQPAADAAHVRLMLHSPPWWLRTDGTALQRVVALLADNAIRHAAASTVRVRAFSDGRGLLIAVRDDGAGLAPDVLAQLAAEVPAARIAGDARSRHGHGLTIARLLLVRLRGRLLLRSSPRGTTFFVHLPRAVLRAAPGTKGVESTPRGMHDEVIVMLDDDATALGASARLFEAIGAQVLTFSEPLDLLSACPTLPRAPRLFILDYRLRDGTCQRVIEALRPWLKDDFHCVVLTGDDAVAAGGLPGLDGDIFLTTKPLADWALARILGFLRGQTARIAGGADGRLR